MKRKKNLSVTITKGKCTSSSTLDGKKHKLFCNPNGIVSEID